jgi:hypothetical protein
MKPVKILAQAVGAWLQYEFACDRSNLFNERYLSVPIATALHAIYKDEVRSEYLHPVLGPAMTGPGRRPEVDFAAIRTYPKVSCVLESKWIGSGQMNAGDILWDLLRLELIAHHTKSPAFFLLAGRRKHLEKFFLSKAFTGEPTSSGRIRPLLKLEGRPGGGNIRVDTPNSDRMSIFNKLFQSYQNISFTSQITTSAAQIYPADCPMYQYQACVWQVLAPAGIVRFSPRNNLHYRFKAASK